MPPPESPRTVTGRIALHPRGFGFVNATDAGVSTAAFVSPPDLNAFFADDLVTATLTPTGDGRWAASDLRLVDRPRLEILGEVVLRRGSCYLKMDREVANTDPPLDPKGVSLSTGDTVIARVSPNGTTFLRRLDTGTDLALEKVIARHAIPQEFSPDVLSDAVSAARVAHTLGTRRDLRDVPTVTIDAASTLDIDDAVSVLPADSDGAVRLLVSIADVSEFVTEGSPLDVSARARATSVYLAGRVIPMLPESLSTGWLSLLPGVDRSCLTVELRIDPEGVVTAVDVYESLIRSWTRLTYDDLAAYLQHAEVTPALEPVRASLPWFRTALARLDLARLRRGGVEIARDEARIVVDAAGEAAAIEETRSTPAHELIERFMVAANEAIADWLVSRGVPGLFRVHPAPDPDATRDLAAFAHNFGFAAGFGRSLTPLALAAFDHQIHGAACEPALRSVLLRALGPARYTVYPSTHFGLAAPLYLHFTSPIRRYADLAVHRTIKRYLHGERAWQPGDPSVEVLAEHVNFRARAAARAETDRHRGLAARYMAGHIGETFAARIVRARPFGLVAQIDTSRVEGVVPTESLPDGPYVLDARESSLKGPVRAFAIGMAVTVRVVATDPALGRITFAFADAG